MIETDVNHHQRRVFKFLLLIVALGGFTFFSINIFRGLTTLALIELSVGVVSLVLYFNKYNNLSLKQFQRLTFSYILAFYALFLYIQTLEGISESIIIWNMVVPMMSYLLMGSKIGFSMTLGFVFVYAFMVMVAIELPDYFKTTIAFLNVSFCYAVVWGIAHAYEKATESSRNKLRLMAITDPLTGLFNRSLLNASFEAAQ